MCPGAKLPYRGDDYAYHAGMYELGERYDLGGLRRSAYESFVRCAFGADIAVPLSESEPPPSPGIEEDRDSEQDIDTETEQLTDKAPSREATVTPSQARIPKIRTIVTTIMRDDRFQHLKPLRDVLVHLLLQIRKDEHRPPGELDSSYLMMTSHLLFARLEKLGTWCKWCRTQLMAVHGCTHGWQCLEPGCRNDMAQIPFCSQCVEFDTGSASAKRLRWDT